MDDRAYIHIRAKIGAAFKKHRVSKNLSLRKVEALTGVDHSWIAKFEKGLVNFEIDRVLRLSSGLKIYLRDLVDFTYPFVEE
jgi:transcriptional regulator with XRE-family HTH domain